MAQFGVQRSAPSYVTLVAALALLGALTYVITVPVVEQLKAAYAAEFTPEEPYEMAEPPKLGGGLYVLALAVIVLGFWSKEDNLVMLGVAGLCLIVPLDILWHVALLG